MGLYSRKMFHLLFLFLDFVPTPLPPHLMSTEIGGAEGVPTASSRFHSYSSGWMLMMITDDGDSDDQTLRINYSERKLIIPVVI